MREFRVLVGVQKLLLVVSGECALALLAFAPAATRPSALPARCFDQECLVLVQKIIASIRTYTREGQRCWKLSEVL